MKLKVDIEKLKKKLKEQEERAAKRSRDPKDSITVKVAEPGTYQFRAVIYPHSEDPCADPFLQRFYHWNLPGGAFYCPQRNDGETCHVCDFVFGKLVENKGVPDVIKKWQQFLPRLNILIAGVIRGREEEGPKFFRFGTRDDKPGENFMKVYHTWFDKEPNWLDPDEGFDMELVYKEAEEGQKAMFRTKVMLQSIDLARKSTKFGTEQEYKEFMKNIPNVDEDIFPRKTTQDSFEILEKWHEILAKRSDRVKASDQELNSKDEEVIQSSESSTPEDTPAEDLNKKLAEMGL